MAKTLEDWIETDVRPLQDRPVKWMSEEHCFRDPARPMYSDASCFLSPADGIILYQKCVAPDEPLVMIKGTPFSLRDALRDPRFSHESLVIGVFMTFFDVHVNRVPYAGRLWYTNCEPIDTYNHPMLEVEQCLVDELRIDMDAAGYLHHNQRVVNRVYAEELRQSYYILQIADYDVDCIMPFELNQGRSFLQGQRFSQIRYGSQVDLIVPLSPEFEFVTVQQCTSHVEAGIDPLVRVIPRSTTNVWKEVQHHALFDRGSNDNPGSNGTPGPNGAPASNGVTA